MRSMRGFYGWTVPALLFAGPAAGADLDVQVNDLQGRPVADAVVSLVPKGSQADAATRLRAAVTKVIDQKDMAFVPYVETFRPGDSVVFRNSDETRHHVYSFSPVKQFQFVLVSGASSAPLRLDGSGVVAVGCNIHDPMISYLYVSDAPWIARPDAKGRATLRDVPAGSYDIRVWHPRLKPGLPDLAQAATVVGAKPAPPVVFQLPLLPGARRQFDREHTHY